MQKMTGHTRLYRRGATYYHRAAIPADIKDTYPKAEETFSLRTKDRQEALKRVRIAAVQVDQRFDEHRRGLSRASSSRQLISELTGQQIKRVGQEYFAFLMKDDEEARLVGFEEPDAPAPPLPTKSFDEYRQEVLAADRRVRHGYAKGKIDDFFLSEAEWVLGWPALGLMLDPKSPSWRAVAREIQAATIRALDAMKARNAGDVVETPELPAVEHRTDLPMLSIAVEDWIAEKARTSWVPKTASEHRVWMSHFIAVAGDRPIDAYNKADAKAFKAVLMSLPPNWNKHAELAGLPLDRASERARDLGMPTMSDKNVNKLLGYVGSFWSWASDNFDDAPLNPFQGLKTKLRKAVREERDPFSTNELNAIFSAPIYTGCKSSQNWLSPGPLVPRNAGMFWVPLIGLFTGARLGEIIQFYTADIGEQNGVRYFDINANGDDKRLKNPNARRRIPIHRTLIELGFLEHVEERQRRGDKRLFPDLEMGADGYYSSPFSKRFGRFLAAVGVKRRTNAFHSFRHSFEDACRDNGVSKEIMDALQGHGERGMSARYGRGFSLETLNDAMAALRYSDLDLTHLCAGASRGKHG